MSQKLKNGDLKRNPKSSQRNMISLRADACKCGDTKCNYAVSVAETLTQILLGGNYQGNELDLPRAPYEVNSIGRQNLEADLKVLLGGLADDVQVSLNSAATPDEFIITVTGSIIELSTANDTDFEVNNCSGTGK